MHPDDWHLKAIEGDGSKAWVNDSTAWSFLLLRSGAGTFSGRSFHPLLKAGDVLVVPLSVEGTLTPEPVGGFSFFHFHFHSELLNGFLRLEERHSLQALVAVGAEGVKYFSATTPIACRYRFLSERMAPPDTLLHRCQLLELVGMFLDLHQIKLHAPPVESLEGKERVKALIEQMPRDALERVSIDELAKRCGCSRRHLNRILTEYLGCSLGTLKMGLRLEKAASMLLSPGAKVLGVALDCGFSHIGQFSAKFRDRFGTTPAVWRRQRLRDAAISPSPPVPSAGLESNKLPGRPGALKSRNGGR